MDDKHKSTITQIAMLIFSKELKVGGIHRSKLYSFVDEKSNTTAMAMNTGFVAEFETCWGDGM